MGNETLMRESREHLRGEIGRSAIDRLKGNCPYQDSSDKKYFCRVLLPDLPDAHTLCPYLGIDVVQKLGEIRPGDYKQFRYLSCNFKPRE